MICRESQPHNRLPGPQPFNRIGTLREQWRRVHAGWQPTPLRRPHVMRLIATIREHEDVLVPVLLDVLAVPIGELVSELLKEGT